MRYFLLLFLLTLSLLTKAQSYEEEIRKYREEQFKEFKSRKDTPLSKKDRKNFKGLPYFPTNEKYRIEAEFIRISNPIPFQMKTTTDRLPIYERYADAVFRLEGKEFILPIYKNHQSGLTEEYEDYLFLPFTDLTNGKETYGGGRYLDFETPEGNTIIIPI